MRSLLALLVCLTALCPRAWPEDETEPPAPASEAERKAALARGRTLYESAEKLLQAGRYGDPRIP